VPVEKRPVKSERADLSIGPVVRTQSTVYGAMDLHAH